MFERLQEDMIKAMKEKDKDCLSVIRGVKGALQLEKINNNKELDDETVTSVIAKQIKMRSDSIEEFKKANRDDLVQSYQKEIDILKKYMPEQLTKEEVLSIIDEVISELGESVNIGKIMQQVTPRIKNRFDMSQVSQLVKQKLN